MNRHARNQKKGKRFVNLKDKSLSHYDENVHQIMKAQTGKNSDLIEVRILRLVIIILVSRHPCFHFQAVTNIQEKILWWRCWDLISRHFSFLRRRRTIIKKRWKKIIKQKSDREKEWNVNPWELNLLSATKKEEKPKKSSLIKDYGRLDILEFKNESFVK